MSEPCAHERDYTPAQAMASYVAASVLTGDAAIERDALKAALGRVREVTAALDRIYVKSAEDAESGYRGAGYYADAYEYATRLLHAALEPTQPKGKP